MQCTIIGAGIIGLSIGWELARSGHTVTLVDPEPAGGATHAAAGMLAAVTEFHRQEADLLALSVPSAAGWPQWARDLEAATGLGTGYASPGTLVVAADAADREALADLAAAQRAAGLRIGELGTTAARAAEPLLAPRLAGAFSAPGDAQADPRRTARALLGAVEAEPRARVLRQRATAVVPCRGGWSVQVGAGGPEDRMWADEVVLATGVGRPGYGSAELGIGGLPERWRRPVRPIHGDVMRLRPTSASWPPAGPTVRALVGGQGVYILPRSDGEVVVGATEREDLQDGVSVEGAHRLLRDALRVMPALGRFELLEATARARPGTPDNLPLLGRIAPGLIAATGFHRHGVLLSVAAAAAVSALVGPATTGRPRHPPPAALDPHGLDPFDPWRFS
ncbi:glycine oxidase ThiO [Arthrobacter sp.]|uniref:glycine oxidase ThiO n=1 Tax=Arthrobacter sp. TaxID=1667 RepID=UPI003A8F1814